MPWQGPSPLPKRHAGIWTGRGPKPPASARPAPGGRFAPAGSGAGLSGCLDRPVYRAPSRTGGETRVAFPVPARRGVPVQSGMPGLSGRGHRPGHSVALPLASRGWQSPRPRARPPCGRWPSLRVHDRSLWNRGPRPGRETRCGSGSARGGRPFQADQDDLPVRHAAGMHLQHPVRPRPPRPTGRGHPRSLRGGQTRAGRGATAGAPAHPLSAAAGPPPLPRGGLRQSGWTRSDSRTNTGVTPADRGKGNPGAAPVPVKRSTQRDISA